MTFAIGHVEGGTGAGRKRPLREKPGRWVCACTHDSELPWVRPPNWKNAHVGIGLTVGGGGRDAHGIRIQPGYLARCPDCGARRDA